MIRKRLGRFAAVLTASSMVLLLVGVGATAAKTPSGWSITVTPLPSKVAPGNDAGYAAVIKNIGPSNVNNVTFSIVPSDTPDATPTYFSGLDPYYDCTETGQVSCYLGTMAAGTEITLVVAYAVPTTSTGTFNVAFRLRAGTGDVDGKNQSRGDAYESLAKTALSSSQNFDAGFVVEDLALAEQTFATGGNVGRNNKHNSQVDVTDTLVTVTIEDDPTGYDPCATSSDPACSSTLAGWTRLTVPNNQDYIKVTLNIWGGSVPGGVGPADIQLLHVLDDGTFEVLGDDPSEICADANTAPTTGECILVTKVGSNYQLVAWLLNNGGLRGIY